MPIRPGSRAGVGIGAAELNCNVSIAIAEFEAEVEIEIVSKYELLNPINPAPGTKGIVRSKDSTNVPLTPPKNELMVYSGSHSDEVQ
jgi:hypothetical protein